MHVPCLSSVKHFVCNKLTLHDDVDDDVTDDWQDYTTVSRTVSRTTSAAATDSIDFDFSYIVSLLS